jgi:hypothetical protein
MRMPPRTKAGTLMFRKVFILLALALLLIPAATTHAQETAPGDLVRGFLAGMGYTVLDVGYLADEQGNADTSRVIVEIELPTSVTAQEMSQAMLLSFAALRKAYPGATILGSLLKIGNLIYIFPTDAAVFDQFINNQITGQQFGEYIQKNAKVFDLTTNSYVTPGTPGGSSSPNKNQTNKDFGGGGNSNTLPCNPPAGKVWFWIRNGYMGRELDFTVGGGEWGTHDYKIPGTGEWKYIEMPPGRYTWSAHIAGLGVAHGERFDYAAGQCYYQNFSPDGQ